MRLGSKLYTNTNDGDLNTYYNLSKNPGMADKDILESQKNYDHRDILNKIRISNANRIIIGLLNINSLRNKLDALKTIISGKIDILVITESKLDDTFPEKGVLIFVREDLPCRVLKSHDKPDNFDGIVLEINLRKVKWLLFGEHSNFLSNFLNAIDTYFGPLLVLI